MTDLSDRELLARQYADERGLAARRRAWNEFLDGPSSDDETLRAVVEAEPRRVLEVGCGWGELSARIASETGAGVIACDLSPRMVGLARAAGVRAFVASADRLPLPDRAFDVVVANAMLYHLPDIDLGVAELGRVLADGGRLVATTFSDAHLAEVWDALGAPRPILPFSAENGAPILARRFASVRRRAGGGTVTFPDADELRTYVAATILSSAYADRVPDIEGPFVTRSRFAVFVAERPIR